VVDAPVSGGPDKIRSGGITLLVGGADEDVAACLPAFRAFAEPILHLGPLGTGQRYKLLNNLLFGANIQLALEISRLGREFGIDAGDLARTLGNCSGSTTALAMVAALGAPETLLAEAGHFVRKDLLVAIAVARELGGDLGLLGTVTGPLLTVKAP
jgi:3-hydroxyisobutyrate dehydrogenase-like beta-hydroxyacid dehydrogenase